MSQLTERLIKLGVPREILDLGQVLLDGKVADAVAKAKNGKKAPKALPSIEVTMDSVQRQEPYKLALRALPATSRTAVETMLPVIVACALTKVHKEVGL